jgi:deoxyribonuclease (pyrimidine dimer)
MTRINLVDPSLLSDQHLIAEYKEILQWCGSFRKSLNSVRGVKVLEIPREFTLGEGHVKFFYDKGLYIKKRFDAVRFEMAYRGFSCEKDFPVNLWKDLQHLWNDYVPTNDALDIIKERISNKLLMKPDWYKWTKRSPEFFQAKQIAA